MNISNKKIWQQACGDTDRNYASVCLDWDVILNGPGYAGAYPDCDTILNNDGWTSRKRTDIKRFAEKMEHGDIVVLRLGTSDVLGVGIIDGNYIWTDAFADIDGWDLQHTRRVNWLWKAADTPKRFATYALKQGDTTQELTSPEIIQWLSTLEIPEENYRKPVRQLPDKTINDITHEEIAEYLYEQGVSSYSIETLIKEFDELRRIAKWYKNKPAPSEFETVAYLVVPILRALGWTPQKMAIEWNNVDVALFDQLPREDKNLSVVVEVKKKGNSCLTAISQAQGYAEGKENCKRLIVTDGLRYGTYIKTESSFKLYAYFNLVSLKDGHTIYDCYGIKEALQIMTPDWREK
jgi:hypothetical protein